MPGARKIKAGRPKKKEEEKNRPVVFSASPALISYIKDRADVLFGGNKTKYIVHKLTITAHGKIKTNDAYVDRLELYKLIKEINKIGTNLNQIARRTNMGFRKDDPLKNALSRNEKKMDEAITLINKILQANNPNF